jgi:hypothetical protein
MDAASCVVAAVDRLALETHRKVTRPLAAEALATLAAGAAGPGIGAAEEES